MEAFKRFIGVVLIVIAAIVAIQTILGTYLPHLH